MQTSAESQLLWWLALATAALVTIVVAALLTLVLSAASAIDDEAGTIRQKASGITVATIQLLHALRINAAVASVVEGAGLILRQAGRVAVHVQSCSGCPDCQLRDRAAPAAAEPTPPGGPEPPPSPGTPPAGRRSPAWSWK